MNVLSQIFLEEILEKEEAFWEEKDSAKYRLTHHLTPPAGWMNDPNGLCFFKGKYHVFFQYSPFTPEGGLKFWGHYTSENLRDWVYEGTALYPDSPYDCHGAYSGSALEHDGEMHIFYTGNVKLEDKKYDYIHNGRKSAVIYVKSSDGIQLEAKHPVLDGRDYPRDYTCHVRDPKVWIQDGSWRMILGGRKKKDKGAALLYRGEDPLHWKFEREITTKDVFGYMWECPDLFTLEGMPVLSVSPQGVAHEEYQFQNLYQSGYFLLDPFWEETEAELQGFQEWDMGFDFYAPQTFQDNKGRRLLIAWMGMPGECMEYKNPTLKEGWQHCMTVPRELKLSGNRIFQYPAREITELRKKEVRIGPEPRIVRAPFDMELSFEDGWVFLDIGGNLFLEYKDGTVSLRLPQQAGAGRRERKARLWGLKSLRVLADVSAAEIYLNQGELVFSTRYYPENMDQRIQIQAKACQGKVWEMSPMTFVKGHSQKEKENV